MYNFTRLLDRGADRWPDRRSGHIKTNAFDMGAAERPRHCDIPYS